nr:hypothetical protein [uncultured bacterium]
MARVGAVIVYRDLVGDSRIALVLKKSEDGLDVVTTQGFGFLHS